MSKECSSCTANNSAIPQHYNMNALTLGNDCSPKVPIPKTHRLLGTPRDPCSVRGSLFIADDRNDRLRSIRKTSVSAARSSFYSDNSSSARNDGSGVFQPQGCACRRRLCNLSESGNSAMRKVARPYELRGGDMWCWVR